MGQGRYAELSPKLGPAIHGHLAWLRWKIISAHTRLPYDYPKREAVKRVGYMIAYGASGAEARAEYLRLTGGLDRSC